MTDSSNVLPPVAPFPDDFGRVLCVVAHPDDIEYGLSAAVAAWTSAGKVVTYFLLTRGEAGINTMSPQEAAPLREAEERASAAVVGVGDVDFGTHRDGVVEYGVELRRDIAREIRRRTPDVVITGTYDDRFGGGMVNQADHRAVGLATLDAAADAGNRWIFPELITEGFEPWSVRYLGFVGSARPTHFVDVTATFSRAVASLEEHAAYNAALPEAFPKPPQLLEMILGGGGQFAGCDKALLLDVISRG